MEAQLLALCLPDLLNWGEHMVGRCDWGPGLMLALATDAVDEDGEANEQASMPSSSSSSSSSLSHLSMERRRAFIK